MGRTKNTPKKRPIEEEEAQKQALETLKRAPTEVVERAAADATRDALEHWPAVVGDEPWLEGLGTSTTIPPDLFQSLVALHEQIKTLSQTRWSSWSGDPNDPRRRAFGILPGTLGECVQDQLDISTPWTNESATSVKEERTNNQRATVILPEPLSKETRIAINWLCQTLGRRFVDKSLRPHLAYEHLIAAQPNLHSGRQLLPVHVDHPLKDGFGVVVVTIGISGSGTIMLQDHATDTWKRKLHVAQGQAYAISGKARNSCAHGVLADVDSEHRESLNLRFGLHDLLQGEEEYSYLPKVSSEDVLKYWDDLNGGSSPEEEEEDAKPRAKEDGAEKRKQAELSPEEDNEGELPVKQILGG